MIKFNTQIQEDTMVNKIYGRQGSPWEFNLRDIFRWCEVMQNRQAGNFDPSKFIDMIYLQRMRSTDDFEHVLNRFKDIFGYEVQTKMFPKYYLTPSYLQIGSSFLKRSANCVKENNIPYPRGLGRQMEHRIEASNLGIIQTL